MSVQFIIAHNTVCGMIWEIIFLVGGYLKQNLILISAGVMYNRDKYFA